MAAKYQPGEAVYVRRAPSIGHVRTPHYIKGKTGVIERICGDFANPEELAYARSGLPLRTLYRVRFNQHRIWPDYAGPDGDTVDIEIYEHWLEPAGDLEA
ncbi:MAG: nitrile hydratase subunit beta [Nitrospinaceae bacterium]|jgi:nitrile hydratase subunit beta|nr:nitrile hydratase subunit beta [Nitrospinaceae bacterium]MBT3435470.1 nitrile hydratase subunit beta [Nitrospinaceae bacterium]MBT4430531.1 nitrile hydratase subunit beta [Nitrospinaceae bacterium]MBT5369356.1 nitrile hydratase subunit beta [Nitrospinaceae bacterium]MBT5947171.1 nitrile hydratase subunit beta [Nitrospinaceae bacterium]